MKSKILDFYEKASLYEKLTKLSYEKKISSKRYFFDFISLENIEIKNRKIIININKQLELFLLNNKGNRKGISPIEYINNKELNKLEKIELMEQIAQEIFEEGIKESSKEYNKRKSELEVKYGLKIEKNRLLFSPVYMKINFIEEDSTVFLPIITFDITDEKENILNHEYKDSTYQLIIDLENSEFSYNNFVTNLFMKDSFKDIQNSILYIANSDKIGKTKELFKKIYENITEHIEDNENNEIFSISFPTFKDSKEIIGLFFNMEENVEIDENYNKLKKNSSKLLEKYLTIKTKENSEYTFKNEIYFGAMTNNFYLGKGQSIVMEKNQIEEDLISVIGPPGTGKTTLFKSIIANNIVKRAMSNIFEGKDYNNLMLITSTSNKAVENVYQDLKEMFKLGLCYIGGNYANRKLSAEEVRNYIEYLKEQKYREGSLESIEEKIKQIVKTMNLSKERYEKTKNQFKEEFGIKKPEQLRLLKIEKVHPNILEESKEYLSEVNELVKEISIITEEKYTIKKVISFLESKDYIIIINSAKKLSKMNFLFEIIGCEKRIYKKIKMINKGFYIEDKDSFIHVAEYLQTIKKYKKEIEKHIKIIEDNRKKEAIEGIDKKYLKEVLGTESFGEYFRKKYFKVNFELFNLSKRYLELKALKNKFSSIEALEFLASGDMYSIKKPKDFLEIISLMYPVVTSTIAGFKYMFRNLNIDIIYESVLADEAGMIKVQDILPLLNRSKRAIIVGDPKQLPPIVTMHFLFAKYLKNKIGKEDFFNMYSPTEVSAYHRAAGTVEGGYRATGYGIILDEHRRCQKEIAELFIKVAEYEGVKIKTPKKEIAEIAPFTSNKIFFNVIDRDKKDKHINQKEIDNIKKILEILNESEQFDIENDVGIITPYNKQEVKLIEAVGDLLGHSKENKRIGTVHKFQGVEFKVIIFSPVVSKEEDSLKFINKDPSMINVAISRAKDLFIVVGDYDKLSGKESGNYIGRMTNLMKDNIKNIDDINFI